jgi:hypothetical protein
MNGMMEGGGAMMWGMGLLWLLVIIVLLLAQRRCQVSALRQAKAAP